MNAHKKRVRRETQQLQERLKNLCEDYEADRKTGVELLEGVGHNIHIDRQR